MSDNSNKEIIPNEGVNVLITPNEGVILSCWIKEEQKLKQNYSRQIERDYRR